jgi:hypothetical protein
MADVAVKSRSSEKRICGKYVLMLLQFLKDQADNRRIPPQGKVVQDNLLFFCNIDDLAVGPLLPETEEEFFLYAEESEFCVLE